MFQLMVKVMLWKRLVKEEPKEPLDPFFVTEENEIDSCNLTEQDGVENHSKSFENQSINNLVAESNEVDNTSSIKNDSVCNPISNLTEFVCKMIIKVMIFFLDNSQSEKLADSDDSTLSSVSASYVPHLKTGVSSTMGLVMESVLG